MITHYITGELKDDISQVKIKSQSVSYKDGMVLFKKVLNKTTLTLDEILFSINIPDMFIPYFEKLNWFKLNYYYLYTHSNNNRNYLINDRMSLQTHEWCVEEDVSNQLPEYFIELYDDIVEKISVINIMAKLELKHKRLKLLANETNIFKRFYNKLCTSKQVLSLSDINRALEHDLLPEYVTLLDNIKKELKRLDLQPII
jgi:hypothetical protein